MTPVTHQPVQPIVVRETHDVHDAPGSLRAHMPNLALALLRMVAGLMFMQHGAQKLFGVLLPASQAWHGAPPMFSMVWVAGVIELGAGLLIAAGLFTRPAAFIAAGQMAVAYFMVHNPRGFFPILNTGELAAMYCFVFLMYAAVGGTRYSLDHGIRSARKQRVVTPRVEPDAVHTAEVELPVRPTRSTRDF